MADAEERRQSARRAIERLRDTVRARIERHPQGHLLERQKGAVQLEVSVPIGGSGPIDDNLVELEEQIDAKIDLLLARRAAMRPGHVYCLRSQSTDSEHSRPRDPRHVFYGYGPTGLPQYRDFAQWLLESGDERVDRLYAGDRRTVARVVAGRTLVQDLLPAFKDHTADFRIHGQVVAGWFRLPNADRGTSLTALTFQVVSTPGQGRRRRLVFNVLGSGPDGEPLERVYERMERVPWRDYVQWAQATLEQIEASQERKDANPDRLSRRIEGLLLNVARRLERDERASQRRTRHAEQRHRKGDRPTPMAMADLARAKNESIFADRRHDTLIVLGDRGRTHVFSLDGKLVTSIRYTPEAIDRKLERRHWLPADLDAIQALRLNVGEPVEEAESQTSPDDAPKDTSQHPSP
ncbi:MAG: hypothetical protein AAGD38_04585 [Acidobacteriota bacterium]